MLITRTLNLILNQTSRYRTIQKISNVETLEKTSNKIKSNYREKSLSLPMSVYIIVLKLLKNK